MGYESLSTVVVLVILMVIAVGWLPRRTVNSMKKVAEHRQDRYSSSLHLVDADSGTRFSDEHTPQPKGAIMQRAQTSTTTPTTAKVAHIRELRRAAVRRRRILALSLLLITVLVLIGFITVLRAGVGLVANLFDDTAQKQEYEDKLEGLVLFDPCPLTALRTSTT